MKYYTKAFSMVELSICIIVMMILTIFAAANIKPNDNKTRLFVYSALSSISNVVGTVVSENGNLKDYDTDTSGVNDKLCMDMADFFSLNTVPNCARASNTSVVNMKFPNGVTIQGLASAWTVDAHKDDFDYKTILIDIDGNTKGLNKVGVDRFPVRIYRKGVLDGTVVPLNCSLNTSGAYCKNANINFAKTPDFISYDIYKAASAEATTAEIKFANKSFMEADCGVYGGGGYFSPTECNDSGYKAMLECTTKSICEKCNSEGVNICAMNGNIQLNSDTCATYVENAGDIACIMLLHKPPAGGGMILDTVLNSVAE